MRPTTTSGVTVERFRETLRECFLGIEPATENTGPVFVCAAGWRSGSTLLQRLAVNDPSIVLWGEPYGDLPILQNHVDVLLRLSMRSFEYLPTVDPATITSDAWIANAYPSMQAIGLGIRSHLHELFAREVLASGHARWGVKAVRWGALEIELLRAAFPGARFVLLVRDPVVAYRSYSAHYPRVWFERYPDRRVDSMRSFASHWSRLASDFTEQEGDDSLLIRYEDIPDRLDEVARHLGVEPDRSVLDTRIRGRADAPRDLGQYTIARLRARTREARRPHGY